MAQQNQHNMPGPGGRGPGGPGARGGFQKPKNLGKTIARLMGYLAQKKWPLLIVLVCLLGSVVTNIAGSSFINLVIINNIAGGVYTSPAGLAADVAKLLGIYAVGWVCTYAQSAIMVQLAQRGTNRLRKDLFDHLQTLPALLLRQAPPRRAHEPLHQRRRQCPDGPGAESWSPWSPACSCSWASWWSCSR